MEVFLNELRQRTAGTLVVELRRKPGARENRWAHLLSGAPVIEAASKAPASALPGDDVAVSELAALKANVARLEAEVAQLKLTLAQVCAALGIANDRLNV